MKRKRIKWTRDLDDQLRRHARNGRTTRQAARVMGITIYQAIHRARQLHIGFNTTYIRRDNYQMDLDHIDERIAIMLAMKRDDISRGGQGYVVDAQLDEFDRRCARAIG